MTCLYFQGGRRSTLDLDLMVYNSSDDTVVQIGEWHLLAGGGSGGRRRLVLNDTLVPAGIDGIFEGDDSAIPTLVVVTKEERPYVMLKEGHEGNQAYDGFAIDLLKARQ